MDRKCEQSRGPLSGPCSSARVSILVQRISSPRSIHGLDYERRQATRILKRAANARISPDSDTRIAVPSKDTEEERSDHRSREEKMDGELKRTASQRRYWFRYSAQRPSTNSALPSYYAGPPWRPCPRRHHRRTPMLPAAPEPNRAHTPVVKRGAGWPTTTNIPRSGGRALGHSLLLSSFQALVVTLPVCPQGIRGSGMRCQLRTALSDSDHDELNRPA